MSDKENRRKCFKCGSSPMEDGIKLFRVLKPGKRNLWRSKLWAKFICPEKEVTSVEFLEKLYNEHKMICEKHFRVEDITDGSTKKLKRTAVPCDMDQAGPSETMQSSNISTVKKCDVPCEMEQDLPIFPMDPVEPSGTVPLRSISNVQKSLPCETAQVLPKISTDLPTPPEAIPLGYILTDHAYCSKNESSSPPPAILSDDQNSTTILNSSSNIQVPVDSLGDHTYCSKNESSASPAILNDDQNNSMTILNSGSNIQVLVDSLGDHTYCSLNEIKMPKNMMEPVDQPGTSSALEHELSNTNEIKMPVATSTFATKKVATMPKRMMEPVEQPGTSSALVYKISNNTQEPIMKTEKEKKLQVKCRKYAQKIYRLQKRINTLKSKNVLKSLVEDETVQKLSEKITPAFALLLQGQIRNTKRKIRGRRWTKEEKITALRIYKRSPTCYRLLGRLFTLPAPSTLKNLLNRVPFGVGCSSAVFKVLKKNIKSQQAIDNEFILMFDEMSLKKHIYYNQKTDLIEGYEDHGTQGRSARIAGYALVFMIGGIRQRVKQPIAHYFSSGFSTADRLAVLIKEVLHHCSDAGINIAAMVCDMDGVNRRALSILGASVEHPYVIVGNKEIVTMYDTPHLLKCFRNLFMKYDIECNTNIHSADKEGRGVAKWMHIRQFYEIDNANPRFVFAPSLKKDHLNPNTKQKMKVNLAAQVLSHSVAAGIFAKISEGTLSAEAAVTATVISDMDSVRARRRRRSGRPGDGGASKTQGRQR